MEEVVEVRNVENVCRLCLTADAPKSSIFGDQESADVPLVAKIQGCLSIQVTSSDKLSTQICTECIKNVNQWHAYKESCLRSQEKLHQWLNQQIQPIPMVVTIKDEPVDLEFCEDTVQILHENDESESTSIQSMHSPREVEKDTEEHAELGDDVDIVDINKDKDPKTDSSNVTKDAEKDLSKADCAAPIKPEPREDEDTDCTIEIESVTGSELLLNPMAVVSGKEDRVMEADSTQKSSAASATTKRKLRRGPHTHYRGVRIFKKKCKICRFNLHSKHSYVKHMERFHSKEPCDIKRSASFSHDEEETVEDLEDELISMEKDSPLTQVQQNIISQLKTFSCYSCQQTFTDRRSTLGHIRQHMPDLRPYTCIACLTEFPDRSIYKLHCGASFECAMKIALVVPKHGVEKYFTCNMCLRPMSNRKELLSHLSKHSDKQYEELTSPPRSPPKLKPMAPLPTPPRTNPVPKTNPVLRLAGPYKGGDPAHNHACDLCGMIYRYKPNMLKHRELCSRLQPEIRTSYRCAHCGMTFLVFKKYHSHISVEHKKKEFTCAVCNAKLRSPSDYLAHHEEHRASSSNADTKVGTSKALLPRSQLGSPVGEDWKHSCEESSPNKSRSSAPKFSCALCGQEFPTRAELVEHRNLHLKVKIYSCVICRSMFSSPGALEIHMKDHGIEDPGERNANSSCVEYGQLDEEYQDMNTMNVSATSDPGVVKSCNECSSCGKIFSNYANLKRHIRNFHEGNTILPCAKCPRSFKSQELFDYHQQTEHRRPKTNFKCSDCSKTFAFEANLKLHRESAHGKGKPRYECDICGKEFLEESSLKIHRSWHNRANSRFSVHNEQNTSKKPVIEQIDLGSTSTPIGGNPERPARARKSFPNRPSSQPPQTQGDLKCQVCDDRFADVTELRKHLWDVHCARNKPEKSFTGDELQCELCTNVFPDHETLKLHMQWHKAHPILSDGKKRNFPCDICGKMYSSKKVLYKHKKLHKATTVASIKFQSLAKKPMASQYLCTICRKVFCTSQTLQRHRLNVHKEGAKPAASSELQNGSRRPSLDGPKAKKIKTEHEDALAVNAANAGKKAVTCHLCRKIYPNMSILYKHKKQAHKTRWGKLTTKPSSDDDLIPLAGADGKVSCNTCGKQFTALNHLRQHFLLKHKHATKYRCSVPGCTKGFPTMMTLQNHETAHKNVEFPCTINGCDRIFTTLSSQKVHEASHKTEAKWKCPAKLCNAAFTTPLGLRNHETVHRNETTWKCSIQGCTSNFNTPSALKAHEANHRSEKTWRCSVGGCNSNLTTYNALKNHEHAHTNIIYSCNLCDKHFFNGDKMHSHMTTVHNTNYEATGKKSFHRETDLNTYVVAGAVDAVCPGCGVKYPNNKALKIHYFKFHETAD